MATSFCSQMVLPNRSSWSWGSGEGRGSTWLGLDQAGCVQQGPLQACVCLLSCFSRVHLFATLWTVACQATLSMGFSRQEYWSGLPRPPPGDLPNPGIKHMWLWVQGKERCRWLATRSQRPRRNHVAELPPGVTWHILRLPPQWGERIPRTLFHPGPVYTEAVHATKTGQDSHPGLPHSITLASLSLLTPDSRG